MEFFARYRLPLPRHGHWRLPGDDLPAYGYIHGLPHSQGTLAVTNGVLCYIIRADDSLFVGHLEWWTGLRSEREAHVTGDTKKRSARNERIYAEYV